MKALVTAASWAAAALALAAGPAQAALAPGALDRSFHGDGKRLLPQPYAASAVLVQADGKIFVIGAGGPANDFVVTRLDPDGSVDRSFDGDGTAVADFGNDDRAYAAALQPDGKIVVAGESASENGDQPAVARFHPDGELDATFDPGGPEGDGKKLLPLVQPYQFDAEAVLVQPDGRIVLVGNGFGADYELAVTRLTSTGAVDGTAWDRGRFAGQAQASAGALTPDGKVVVAGTHTLGIAPSEIAMARFGSDGKLDGTFGGSGTVTFASEGNEAPSAVLVQPDGKIVVAGSTHASGSPQMVVTRFEPDGTPDASWDGDGRAFAGFDAPSLGAAAALQPDGKVVVAGVDAAGFDMAVVRFEPDGSPDASFGSRGRATVDFGFIEVASAVALQRNGRIVLAGQAAAGASVARLLGDVPQLTGLRVIPARFARGNGLPRQVTGRATRRSPQIRFTLSEPARLRFTFQRARLGGYRTVQSAFAVRAQAGAVRVRFQGRLGARRWLAPGRYRLIASPVDRAGTAGPARRATFRLLPAEGRK